MAGLEPFSYPSHPSAPQTTSNTVPPIAPEAPQTILSSTSSNSIESIIGPHYPLPQQNKMPVSELIELGMRMGLEVQFESSMTGLSHNREFVMTCTVGGVAGQGRGSSKKMAKHAAAAVVLERLKESDAYKNHLFNRSSKAALSSHNNTVGRLQETTAKKGLQNPEYQFETATGPPHQRVFSTRVHVGTLLAEGTGRSKKEAKRSAAAAMLDNINSSNLSLHVPAKKIAFKPASSSIDHSPILFTKGGML